MTDEARVHIRPVRPDEWRELRALRLRALASDPTAFDSSVERERARTDAWWRERALGSERLVHYVAEDARGTLVGLAGGFVDEDGSVGVFTMWTAPEVRGRGVGAALLDAVLAWARDAWPDRPVALWVNVTRAGARRLYESRGFRGTGRVEPFEHVRGEVGERMVLLDT